MQARTESYNEEKRTDLLADVFSGIINMGCDVSREPRSPFVPQDPNNHDRLFKSSWRQFGLLSCLDDETMQECISCMKVQTFPKGETIIKKGSVGTSLYFLDMGTARVAIKDQVIQDLKGGNYFGEIAFNAMVKKMLQDQSGLDLTDISNVTGRLWQMATNQPPEKAIRMADVKAISECRMLTLEAKDFVELLLNHPECKHPVLRLMEQTAEVNKRNVQSALSLQHETQAPTHEELQLVKACWSQFGLFSCLDDETMLECAKCMMVQSFSKGATIIKKGSVGTTLYLMDTGSARVEVRDHELMEIHSGRYFGEIAFSANVKNLLQDSFGQPPEKGIRMADVKAITACRTLTLEARDFAELLRNHPSCRTNFFRLLDERSTENMKNVWKLEKRILSQQQMQLLKSSWRHFGLFNHLNDEIMQECARRMKVQAFSKGDIIIRRGSVGTTLYLMDMGSARVGLKDKVLADIHGGQYFGEIAFTAMVKKMLQDHADPSGGKEPPQQAIRMADVKATAACRTLTLEAWDLVDLLRNHPGAKKKIIQSIEKRSDENKRNVQRLLTQAAYSSSRTTSTKIGRHQDAMDDARYGR